MPKYLSRLTPLASAVLITAVLVAPAHAAGDKRDADPRGGNESCEPQLMSGGAEFILTDDGYVDDSTSFGHDDDTWDDAGELSYRIADDPETDDDDFDTYEPEGECTMLQGGREVGYADEEIDDDLVLARRAFVPAAGAFLRTYDTITNTGSESRTVDLALEADQYSDEDAAIGASSSGDRETTPADAWFTQIDADGADGEYDSANGTFNFGSEATPLDRADEFGDDYIDTRRGIAPEDDDVRNVIFRDIEVAPGETVAYVHAFGQAAEPDGAAALADSLGDAPDALFAGLSADEQNAVRNWNIDGDGDGIKSGADNCPTVANADQADLDKDGEGDACDADADNDGIPNDVEANLGTNALSGDSDGDGVADGRDQCPALAGTINGCPAPVTVLQQSQSSSAPGRALPPGVTLSISARRNGAGASAATARAAQSGGVMVRTSGRIQLPRGLSAAACEQGRIAVVVKTGRRTISTRVVDVKSDCTYRSNVTFKRKLRSSVRAKSYFFGSRGLVGRAAKSKSASVK